jgi:hypothetical protein
VRYQPSRRPRSSQFDRVGSDVKIPTAFMEF